MMGWFFSSLSETKSWRGLPVPPPQLRCPCGFGGWQQLPGRGTLFFPWPSLLGYKKRKLKEKKFKKKKVEVHGSWGGGLARSATSAGGTKQCSLSPPQHLSLGCRQIDLQRLRLAAQPALHSQRSPATQ